MIALDSGALIGLERRDGGVLTRIRMTDEDDLNVIVSAMAVAEVWRQPPHALVARTLDGCRIVPVDDELARIAGAAIGATGASAPDAIIAATAARAGAPLLTTDADDMRPLADYFRALHVIAL